MSTKDLVGLVHQVLRAHLNEGEVAIDATVGNGLDTLFLAECVGEHGKVYGFDIQEKAVRTARDLLKEKELLERVELSIRDHQHILNILPETVIGKVAVVMFNLGYLPGSDRSVVTKAFSTINAIQASLKCIRKDSIISIMAYKGHVGGGEEFIAVKNFLEQLDLKRYSITSMPTSEKGPEWLFLKAKF